MKRRFLAALVSGLALAGPVATAGGAEVSVRVEGQVATHFEDTVTATIHPVDGGDGSGPHPCSGSTGEAATSTLTGALDDAMRAAGLGWHGSWNDSAGDFLIDRVAGEEATPAMPWSTLLNGQPTPTGGCTTPVKDGDRVLLAYDAFLKSKTLGLSGPGSVEPGKEFSVRVFDLRAQDGPVPGAVVSAAGDLTTTSDADGRAAFTITEPGTYGFKASHPEGIRSNAVSVCVGVNGCANAPEPDVAPSSIEKIENGQRFLRRAGPRILRGRLADGIGVKLALTSRRGERCRSWSVGKRRMVRRACAAKPTWMSADLAGSSWSAQVGPLRPGRYRLISRAVAPATAEPWRTGINRIGFRILPRRLRAHRLTTRAAAYLRSDATEATIRTSPLIARWVSLALGVRGDRSEAAKARRLTIALLPAQAPDGSFAEDPNLTATAVIALRSKRPESSMRAAGWLEAQQDPDGGFGFSAEAPADVDTTGLVAWALALNGRDAAVSAAAGFVRGAQNFDGGLPAIPGGESNSQSTGLGMIALRLNGRGPLRTRTEDGISPVHYLAALQRRNGSLRYAPGITATPSWVTAQALLGLTPRAGLLRR